MKTKDLANIIKKKRKEQKLTQSQLEGYQAMTILKDGKQLQNSVLEMVKAISQGKEPTINDTSTYNNGVMDMKTFLCKPELIDRSNLSKLL